MPLGRHQLVDGPIQAAVAVDRRAVMLGLEPTRDLVGVAETAPGT